MTDEHKISDTIKETTGAKHLLGSEDAPRPNADTHRNRYVLNVTPAQAADEAEGYLILDDGTRLDEPVPNRRARRSAKKPMIIALVIAGVLLVGGVLAFVLSRGSGEPSVPSGSVAENVTVNGVRIGGMSYDAAMGALIPEEQRLAESIRVEVAANDRSMTFTKEDFLVSFNTDEVVRRAFEDGAGSYRIAMKIDEASFAAIADKAAAQTDKKVQDAKVASFNADKKEMFTYQEGVPGLKLDKEDLIAKLRRLIEKGSVSGKLQAKVDAVKPAHTVEYLKQNIRRLSAFTTESTNTSNAMSNQALSLSSCNSSIIEPGATWSFNKCTGDSNLESRGYLPASVIVQGHYEIGIGGGICQSSTTIYNAALLCGMAVVERECHALPTSYVDLGLDATIDYGNIDLKLKNPFSTQLFLKCWMDGVILHAEFYGLPQKDFDEIRVSVSQPSRSDGYVSASASRTFYLDGKSVRTESLPYSTYIDNGYTTDTPVTPSPVRPIVTPTTPPTEATTPTDTPTDPPATDDEA